MKQNLTFTSLTAKWQIRVVALFMLLFSATSIQAQCTGTTIAFTWGGGTTYNYSYDGIRNGKCAFKQVTPGTSIEWNGTQWCIYGNAAYLGTVFFHSTVDVGDRPSNNLADWVSDMGLNMISLTGTGTIDHPTQVGPTSKVKDNQCGSTLTSLDQNINADYVSGYEQYRFEVTNGATINTVDVNKYNFSLTQTPGITYNTTYSVRVAVKMGGTWGPYGASCNITTPSLSNNTVLSTHVHPNFCGTTLAALTTKIPAKPVQDAQGYRFEITTGGVTTEYDTTAYFIQLSQTGVVVDYGMTYTIRVAALVNGIYGVYGTSCDVSTPALATNNIPTTQVHPNFCGTTLAALDTKIPATPILNATGYRFEIITGGVTTVYDSATYNFKLSQSGAVVANATTYAIRVAALVNGIYGNYGASCNVTTPGGIARHIADTTEFAVAAYPNPFNTAFKLQVNASTDETVFISVYDMMGKQVENKAVTASEIENVTIGQDYAVGIYNVLVAQGTNTKTVRLVKN